jgi:hypothetical protein
MNVPSPIRVQEFISIWNDILEHYPIPTSFLPRHFNLNFLPCHGFMNTDELRQVMNTALQGIHEGGLNRLNDLRSCLRKLQAYLFYRYEGIIDYYQDWRTWRDYDDSWRTWGEYDRGEPDFVPETYQMMDKFNQMIDLLDPKKFQKMINLATPEEKLMARSLLRQFKQAKLPRLPREMRKEIKGWIGFKGDDDIGDDDESKPPQPPGDAVGGRYKKTKTNRNARQHQRNKSKKYKTRRHKTRRHKNRKT